MYMLKWSVVSYSYLKCCRVLTNNKISDLASRIFESNSVVSTVSLNKNALSTIPDDVFGETTIYNVDLSDNQLVEYPAPSLALSSITNV